MRFPRFLVALGAAGVLAALVPQAAQAQSVREFENSWFWGVKGGTTWIYTSEVDHAPAPLVGVEWLITRRHVGLSLSIDQAYFSEQGGYTVFGATGAPVGESRAEVTNLRRFTAQLFVFPKTYGRVRPYAGAGLSLNLIQEVDALGPDVVGGLPQESLDEQTSAGSAVFTGGAHITLASRLALFAQASYAAERPNFVLQGGDGIFVEAGLRYNLASAIADR